MKCNLEKKEEKKILLVLKAFFGKGWEALKQFRGGSVNFIRSR